MTFLRIADFRNTRKSAYTKIASVIVILAIIGLSTVSDYGVSWDEKTEIAIVKNNFDLIAKNEPIPGDLKYYGIIFNLTSEVVFQVKEFLSKGFSYNPLTDKELENERLKDKAIYDRIKVKHPLTFLLSLVTYASVAGIVGILAGLDYAWFGSVTLALFPRFWGHSFFNPKDIPFAAMFTFATFLGACLVGSYVKADKDIKLGINPITIYSLLYGILVGLITGIRIGGFFLLFFVAIAHLFTEIERGSIYRKFSRFWSFYGLMFVAWITTTIIIHPASWSNPVGWFFETLGYLSKHGWEGDVLFEGQFIPATSLPWYYLPKWLFMTIPIIFQIAFFLGLVLFFYQYPKLDKLQRACIILVLLQIFFLPAIAILKQSTIYDGMRQFLFMLPGIAAISATALVWIYQKISRKIFKIFAIALMLVLCSPIVFDMVALHPYEYIYFNRISGGLAKARDRYETDYWGLSMRKGMEWINDNASPNSEVVVSGDRVNLFSATIFSDPDLSVISLEEFESEKRANPDYYLALPRWQYQSEFPECPVVHQVTRQNVPLTIVKKCE